ncbi:MAG: putative Ig domain-containing protein [Candidatus Dojkabacteria bacterium]|nr:putative Ig domain-containing protein [Candidatus Dojkabacteria bacterium]
MRKVVVAVSIFIVAFAIPVIVHSLIERGANFDNRENAAEEVQTETNLSIPEIVSVPPTSAVLGEVYTYRVRATDDDGDAVEYRASQYPSWLTWYADLAVLEGTPLQTDAGTHTVRVIATDGKWLKEQVFDIVVPLPDGSVPEIQEEQSDERPSVDPEEDQPVSQSDDIESVGSDQGVQGHEVSSTTVSETDSEDVLGVSETLPDTAVFKGWMVVGIGSGLTAMALFLWLDARFRFFGKAVDGWKYAHGQQIRMDVGEGISIKKRKVTV